jgi:hypothetical protein
MYLPGIGEPARGWMMGAGAAKAKAGKSDRRRVSCMIAVMIAKRRPDNGGVDGQGSEVLRDLLE